MRKVLVTAAIVIYLTLCAVCLFAPEIAAASSVLGIALLGPPALLFWGSQIWPLFLGASIALAGLLVLAIRFPEGSPVSIGLAVALWLGSGWLSAGLSI